WFHSGSVHRSMTLLETFLTESIGVNKHFFMAHSLQLQAYPSRRQVVFQHLAETRKQKDRLESANHCYSSSEMTAQEFTRAQPDRALLLPEKTSYHRRGAAP